MTESVSSSQLKNFVGGEFAANANVFRVSSAFDSSVHYDITNSDLLVAIQAIQTAQKAFYSFPTPELEKNIETCTKILEFLQTHKTEIARELARFQGASFEETLKFDVEMGLAAFRRILQEVSSFDSQNHRPQATGLVILIGPAILSFKTLCERLAPAIMAGNSVILKPSSKNPLVGRWLALAAQAASVTKGFVNVLYGRGETIGAILCSHPSVRAVSFAGSLKVGEVIIKNASAQFKKVQVSTTQKNIAAVLSDADLDLAVREILKGTLFQSGQSPFSIHRVFVVEAVAPQFIEKLRAQVESIRPITDIEDKDPHFVSSNLLTGGSAFDSMLATAIEAHAKVMTVATKFQGSVLKPIFTLDMTNCSTLQQDDIQAPLLILTTVKYQHEVQKYANVGYYGSTAFLFGSIEKCEKVTSQLQARHFVFNEWRLDASPMVSSRQSFFGDPDFRAFGTFYSELKTILRKSD